MKVPARSITLVVVAMMGCGHVELPDSDACVPETDAELCAAIGKTCESQTSTDNCGQMRTAECGTCAASEGCVVGVCLTPVCSTFNYTSEVNAGLSRAGLEDTVAAATPDGQVIVVAQAQTSCGEFHMIVADETVSGSGTYTPQDVTTQLAALGMFAGREGYAITADGLTLIGKSTDSKSWMATTRSAIHQVDFAPASTTDFAAINATITGNSGQFGAPVISADGLEFFYAITQTDANTNGIYSAVRSSTAVPFPAGIRLPPPVQDDEYVASESADRLTLFLFTPYQSDVLIRSSTNGAWINPNAPAAPPAIPGWDHKVLGDCVHLVGVSSAAGGCQNEDSYVFTRQ